MLAAQVLWDHVELGKCRPLWSQLGYKFQGAPGAGALQTFLEQSTDDGKPAGSDRLGKEDKVKEFRRKFLYGVYT